MSQKGSHKARKTAARLTAVQCLYQLMLNPQTERSDIIKQYAENYAGQDLDGAPMVMPDMAIVTFILDQYAENSHEIDEKLNMHLDSGRTLEDFDVLLQAVFKSAYTELLYNAEVVSTVIVNDYINVTKAFYEQNEYKLVNVVLDKMLKSLA